MSAENQHSDLHELIAKQLGGEITPIEETQLETLLLKEDNKRIHEDLIKIWKQPATQKLNFNPQDALSKLNNRIIENHTSSTPKQIRPQWLVAASIIILIGTLFLTLNTPENTTETVSIQTAHFTEVQSLPIPDGTIVDININSVLEHPKDFNNDTREVKLEGKAFFDVAHNKEKPFIIHTEQIDIRVLGTSFYANAEKEGSEVSVSVITGIVKLTDVSNRENTITLKKGQKGVFNRQTQDFKISQSTPNDYFWKTKTLSFSNTDLSTVIASVNKHYSSDIVIKGRLEKETIETTFENNSTEEIVEIIQALTECRVTRQGKKILLE